MGEKFWISLSDNTHPTKNQSSICKSHISPPASQTNPLVGGDLKRKAGEMDNLLDQVTSGRVFKRLADFAFGRQSRSRNSTAQSIPDSLEPARKDDSQILRAAQRATDLRNTHDGGLVDKSTQTLEINARSSGTKLDDMEEITVFDGRRAGDTNRSPNIRLHSGSKYKQRLFEISMIKGKSVTRPCELRIPSRPSLAENPQPEIFTYRNREGRTNSALTLTDQIIRQWNSIFRLQTIIQMHLTDMERLKQQEEELEEMVAHLNDQVHIPSEFVILAAAETTMP